MPIKFVIRFFTSLRLTVVLLAFAILLVFIGTLAQVDEGLYNAQARYFRQWLIFGINLLGHKIPLILPGGYLIGTMLLVNLLAAHIYRFQFTVKKLGIQIAHAGVILLLVGQLATDMFAHESQIRFAEGETKTYAESSQNYELAFTVDAGADAEQVITIPQSLLVPGREIQDSHLPFTIRVRNFEKNSGAEFRAPMVVTGPPVTTNGVAVNFDFQPQPEVKTMDDKNVPTALIEIVGPNGSLGNWVVSGWTGDAAMVDGLRQDYTRQVGPEMARQIMSNLLTPQSVAVGGKKFTFALRPERIYLPFSPDPAEGDPHRLPGHGHSQGFSQPRAIAKFADGREPRGGDLHERSAALFRHDLLPVSDDGRRNGGAGR